MRTIADIRRDYQRASLDEADVAANPYDQFDHWWHDVTESQLDEANAMTLCSLAEDGTPDGRIVLLKGYDRQGFVFYTNYLSDKGRQLAALPKATLVFFWKELERQVRISGTVEQVTAAESDDYFHSRPKESRIGAHVSEQSSVIPGREVLEQRYAALSQEYADIEPPRPAHWGGYRVVPQRFEFWQGRPSRLHDRFLYTLEQGQWLRNRLSP